MKIYNEIITIFNDKTQKWETILEDSFEYGGPVMLAAGQPTSFGNICGDGGSHDGIFGAFDDISSPCCQLDALVDMESDTGDTLYLGVFDSVTWQRCGESGGYDYSTVLITHSDIQQGWSTGVPTSVCCMPNNVKSITFKNSGNDATGGSVSTNGSFVGPIPFCATLKNPDNAIMDADECRTTQDNIWSLDEIHFNDHNTCTAEHPCGNFTLTAGNDDYPNFGPNPEFASGRQQNWLCSMADAGAMIYGCTGFNNEILSCDCPNEDACETLGDNCDSGIACSTSTSNNQFYCSSGMDCLDGDCMLYPDGVTDPHCEITNNCGICGASDEALFICGPNGDEECCMCTESTWDDCRDFVPDGDSCGGTAVFDDSTGLFTGSGIGSNWCSCNNKIAPTTVTCIDRYSLQETGEDIELCLDSAGAPDEFAFGNYPTTCGEYPMGCTPWTADCAASNDPNCCHYVGSDMAESSELYDTGCRDPLACNYSSDYELDCEGCCIYPLVYCIADGSLYEDENYQAAGNMSLCDVDVNNNPSTVVYCPICDCGNGDFDCPQGSCANQTGYSDTDPGSSMSGIPSNNYPQSHWYIDGSIDEGLQNNGPPNWSASGYLAGSGGAYDGTIIFAELMDCTGDVCEEIPIADDMLDTSLEEWILTGCTDPAALNFNPNQQALWEGAEVQDSSTICDYCPGTNEYGCPSGYEFHWADEYYLGNVTTQANVSVDTGWVGEGINFPNHFNLQSEDGSGSPNLISPSAEGGGVDTYGACFCIDDLQFLDDLMGTLPDNQLVNSGLQINGVAANAGVQEWDSYGRLSKFTTGGETSNCTAGNEANCREMGLQLGNTDGGAPSGILPTSIGNLEYLTYLDLSFGYLQGDIPVELGNLTNLVSLNLSYNYFNRINIDEHFTDLQGTSYGLCNLVDILGQSTYGISTPDNYWLKLMGNRICPEVESQYLMTTTYPNCLSPQVGDSIWTNPNIFTEEWQRWVYYNLGFIELPNTDLFPGFNHDAQDIYDENLGELICENLTGCKIEYATNYWPEANNACPGNTCCTFDRFLHFPWGNTYGPPEGSFGGDMTEYQMVQALHANIFGFQYNNFGHLDVTGYPTSAIEKPGHIGACDYDEIDGALPMETIYNCQFGFSNDPSIGGMWTDYVDGNGVISHWDGIWLRDNGNKGDGTCMTFTGAYIENDNGMQSCDGDSRPLDYIQRIEYEDAVNPGEGIKNYWFNQFFPAYGADISFQGIEWYEDYDINNDGQINNSDAIQWENERGRYDISEMIGNMPPYPDNAPDDVELWEQTPVYVSMSYSQKFVSETEAGFTLWSENNSPGILQRSGQWQCADGGDASVCYEDMMACSDGLPDWVEECTPCGMETSPDSQRKCVPLITDTAAEGHEKISKTKIISVPYFSNGNSNILIGSDIYTASLSSSNHPYYFSVMDGNPNLSQYDSQFDVSWGHYAGSGSYTADDTIKGTSEAVYKQYASMLLGDKIIDNGFLISSGSDVNSDGNIDGNKDEWIYVLNFKRKRFEDQLQSANWTLILSGSGVGGGSTIHLTDDSAASTVPPHMGHVGYRYNIISGSAGTPYSGYSTLGDRYGFFYPEIGIMILGEKIANVLSGDTKNPDIGVFNSASIGNNSLSPLTGSNVDAKNSLRFINCMRNVSLSPDTSGSALTLYGEKTVTDVIYTCILNNNSFNFTNNFSILSGSGRKMYISGVGLNPDVGVMNGFNTAYTSSAFTSSDQPSAPVHDGGAGSFYESNTTTVPEIEGGSTPFIWPGSNVPTMHGFPTTFITGIELFDEHGECLATARLSTPLRKDFEKEAVIKVKLSY